VHHERDYPLDFENAAYAYLERPNSVLLRLLHDLLPPGSGAPRILDVGCGAGANGRRLRGLFPNAVLCGIEPHPRAAAQARTSYDVVFEGSVEQWLDSATDGPFDAVVLSDVLEHVVDPVGLLRRLVHSPPLQNARWFVSVPNCAVWYGRARALLGSFDYAWSGLYDRTHLRFFTRRSLHQMLRHCGLSVLADACTPSLAQSAAPWLRLAFQTELAAGQTLSLGTSRSYVFYQRFVEPTEAWLCGLWPELLGFQIVVAACRADRGT
jgi:SAM-dependent methyltransferase